jgi:hypothetical protein
VSGGDAVLRVAFDMDGVLADMHTVLAIEAKRIFAADEASTVEALEEALELEPPPSPPAAPLPEDPPQLTLTMQQTQLLWERVAGTHDFWEGLAETEAGVVRRLARIADERRWEVIFLTQRPPTRGATVQKQTQAWLRRYGFDCPSVFTTRGSRGAIAAALHLDVVVDDRFEGCVAVVGESTARAILVSRHPDDDTLASARRKGITVVRSAGDCLSLLERTDRPSPSSGLMSRLRRVLGLTGTAPPGAR